MLLHRRRPPNAGSWNGIGGKLEPGEDPFTACLREVREETGFSIAPPVLRALLIVTVRASGDLWVIYVFTAPAPDGEPEASDEGELQWVDADRVASLHTPADVPLVLARILGSDDTVVLRLEYETEDPSALTRVAILGG